MDVIEKIRQLVALMVEQDLAELEVEEPEFRVRIKGKAPAQYSAPAVISAPYQINGAPQQPALKEPSDLAIEEEPAKEEDLVEITAPMIGTFFRAASDGAEPYVITGAVVEPDTVVCILEAMKVMNEVRAEVSGEIVEILVQNAEPVEYGQTLFLARPAEE